MNTPPARPSSTSILHDHIVKPLPPHNSCSLSTTTAPFILPAIVILHLCRRSFVDCCFFVIVVSAVVAPRPPTVVACPLPHLLRLFSRRLPVLLHLILPPLLVRHCTGCALVDCCFLLVAALWLPLNHRSCLSIAICHAVCRGAALMYKTVNAIGVIFYPGIFFLP
jgi:hypothetical protein